MTDEEDSEHESAMLRIIEKEKIPHVPRLIEAGQGALWLSPVQPQLLWDNITFQSYLFLVLF